MPPTRAADSANTSTLCKSPCRSASGRSLSRTVGRIMDPSSLRPVTGRFFRMGLLYGKFATQFVGKWNGRRVF